MGSRAMITTDPTGSVSARFSRASPRAIWLAGAILILRLGWGRSIAIAALIASISVHLFVIPELVRRSANVRQEVARLAEGKSAAPVGSVQDERYEAFRAMLTRSAARDDVLKAVFAEANAANIELSQGEHEWLREYDGAYEKMRLSLPLRGSAKHIRQFVYATLVRLPSASLDQIRLRRDTVKAPLIEARIELTIYFKDTD